MSELNETILLLQSRQSVGLLAAPAPSGQQLEQVCQAALAAPDHGRIKPWRYLLIEEASRQRLGELFASAMLLDSAELSDEELSRYKKMPFRAPLIIVAIASIKEHPKVPETEQLMSAAVGVGYMLVALQSLGFGGYWRTGPLAYNKAVQQGLGLSEDEQLIGFLYVGSAIKQTKEKVLLPVKDFFQHWV